MSIPPRVRLLGSWLTERHRSMVYAPTGLGKSWFSLSVALALAGGGEALGWSAPEARPVLYVDGEMDLADLRDRVVALAAGLPGVDLGAARRNLHFLSRYDQGPSTRFPDLATEDGQEVLMEFVEELKPSLVVLDNLSTLLTVADENAASCMDPIVELLNRLTLAGSAVLVVHHARKGQGGTGGYRGSSKLAVTFESIIRLSPARGADQGAAFQVDFEKLRGARDQSTEGFEARLQQAGRGALSWEVSAEAGDELGELLRLVRSGRYGSQKAVADALGLSQMAVSRLKGKAIDTGRITTEAWARGLSAGRSQHTELVEDLDEADLGF